MGVTGLDVPEVAEFTLEGSEKMVSVSGPKESGGGISSLNDLAFLI